MMALSLLKKCRTARSIWALSALPLPVRTCLASRAGSSTLCTPFCAPANRTTPETLPRVIPDLGYCFKEKISSMTMRLGLSAFRIEQSSENMRLSRLAKDSALGVRIVPKVYRSIREPTPSTIPKPVSAKPGSMPMTLSGNFKDCISCARIICYGNVFSFFWAILDSFESGNLRTSSLRISLALSASPRLENANPCLRRALGTLFPLG